MRKLYKIPNTVVNVQSLDECEEYLKMCEDVGWGWVYHKIEDDLVCWLEEKENTCLTMEKPLCYSSISECKEMGYKIITFKQLKERLVEWKQGDIIVNRDEKKRKIHGVCGNVVFVTTCNNTESNIVERFTKAELERYGYTLQKEPEKVKMTVREVCNKLGKEVEIIKENNNE